MKPIKQVFFATIFLSIIATNQINAQSNSKNAIRAVIGYGLVAPSDDSTVIGTGLYAQGEYIIGINKWFDIRPYVGFIFTSGDKDIATNPYEYKVTSNAILLGGKGRLTAPSPYLAPYIELGLGLSAGSFRTYTPDINQKGRGAFLHIPLALGVSLGKKRKVDLEITYYIQPILKQFSATLAVGLTLPLNKKTASTKP